MPEPLRDRVASIVKLAQAQRTTLATFESCTAGSLANLLSQAEGASSVLHGGFIVRWVRDSRDETPAERIAQSAEPSGIFGCRQILNCAKACPKGLNPAKAIAELRKLQLGWSKDR